MSDDPDPTAPADADADLDRRYLADAATAAAALDGLVAEAINRGMHPCAVLSGIHGALIVHYVHLAGWRFAAERCRAAAEQVELGFRPSEGSA